MGSKNFNSHAHVERDYVWYKYNCWNFYFNSHAHVERDTPVQHYIGNTYISTHTLTWSVTYVQIRQFLDQQTFQLTRSRGAWHKTTLKGVAGKDFNSHAHVERDRSTVSSSMFKRNFNSHAHVERDVQNCNYLMLRCHFNSHAHVERDEIVRNWINAQSISTHTLTWSVTMIIDFLKDFYWFQLTRSRGAWRF